MMLIILWWLRDNLLFLRIIFTMHFAQLFSFNATSFDFFFLLQSHNFVCEISWDQFFLILFHLIFSYFKLSCGGGCREPFTAAHLAYHWAFVFVFKKHFSFTFSFLSDWTLHDDHFLENSPASVFTSISTVKSEKRNKNQRGE